MSRKTIAWGGDSQSDFSVAYGVAAWATCGPRLATNLNREGYATRTRAFGKAGDTTTQLLARADALFFYDTPTVGVLYIGVNDPGASITQAQTQANIQALIKVLKHRAIGDGLGGGSSVAGQANLPSTGEPGQRYVVLADTSTTGGAAAQNSAQAATITGSVNPDSNGQKQTVWEYRHPLAGEAGWGRVATAATAPTAVKKIIVVSTNYLNFTSGGDTPTTPYATYAPVRAAQQAAVAAENVNDTSGVATVVYADLYTLMKSRIAAGTDPDFSSVTYDQTRSWHYTSNNQHHSAYGHSLVAQAARAAMPNAWLPALLSAA